MNWPCFEDQGISLDNILAQKLWRLSRILEVSPFDEIIMGLNVVQMNFILRMYAQDHPDELKVIDPEISRGENQQQVWVEWSNRLTGDLKKEFDRNPIFFFKKYFNTVGK